MQLKDFNYELPDGLIAQVPARPRDSSRLLVVERKNGALIERRFSDIVDYFQAGDLLVLNNSKVIPARLIGKKSSGGKVEIFLSKRLGGKQRAKSEIWECLVKGRHIQAGMEIYFSKTFSAVLKEKTEATWSVVFNKSGAEFEKALQRYGLTPLPPYIKPSGKNDVKDYQTVFADAHKAGSVAAPTAGLHFTPRLLRALKKKGVVIKTITLHVGLGTFLPVRVENIKKHRMHGEWVEVSAEVKKAIIAARKKKKKVIAVGTTTVRSLEAALLDSPTKVFRGYVEIFIYPSFKFKAIDGMITNFHLPQSTLLMLVSAFAGSALIRKAYAFAVKNKFCFYSYGDAMLIL